MGQVPQYYVEDSHPAIIDKDMWESGTDGDGSAGRNLQQSMVVPSLNMPVMVILLSAG